jgi:hypothetical protein
MSQYIGIVIPLLLHLGITEIVAAVFGDKLDAAARTLLVSLMVLPWAVWMYQKDKRMAEKKLLTPDGRPLQMAGKKEMSGSAWKEDAGRRVSWHRNVILRGLFCFILGGALNLAWSRLLILLQIQQQFSNETQEALFAGQIAVQLLSMGCFVPLTEELVFRGLIYRRMRGMLPYGQAVILASALFAVYHGNMIQMIFAFPMAVVICILYEKWESLRYPVLFHMGCNLTAILLNSL